MRHGAIFIAQSPDDRRGAASLLNQVAGAMEGPTQPIEEAAAVLPHYRVVVRRQLPRYLPGPWPRPTETSFIYYPGGAGTSFNIRNVPKSTSKYGK